MVPNILMYIRPKKVKGHFYAYLVRSYRSKRPKKKVQKVVKYLGKIYEIKDKSDLTFEEYLKKDVEEYLKGVELKEIIQDLLTFELIKHGFEKKGKEFSTKELVVNFSKNKIYHKDTLKNVSIMMNEGFLNEYTLTKLFGVLKEEGDERELGFKLANSFISAGLKVEEDIYIGAFNKLLDIK